MDANTSPFRILDFGHVQVQVQIAPITAENFAEHLRSETERILERVSNATELKGKVVVIVDGSVALMPPPAARKLQADWLKENEPLLRQVTHKMAFVLPNPLVRAFVAAIFAIVPLPVASTTHGGLDAAVRWAVGEVEGIGGEVAAEIINEGSIAVERARQRVRGDLGLA